MLFTFIYMHIGSYCVNYKVKYCKSVDNFEILIT